jgi:oligopeptide transport system substrate-binding protein
MRALMISLLIAAAGLSGCSGEGGDGPIAVSVIGAMPRRLDPNRQPLAPSDAVLIGATAQGLVRFDGAGQAEPGVAIRWAVSDNGLYYTFRIDGGRVTAQEVARRLRQSLARTSRNPLRPVLGAIDEIVAVTPEVVELRLHAPRPNLLQLLAQPEMTLAPTKGQTGPFRIAARSTRSLLLAPIDPGDGLDEQELARGTVRLRGERAALALARFDAGEAAVILGGTFRDLPLVRAAGIAPRLLQLDPVSGLFGLSFLDTQGFLGSVENRRALAMAIDRDRLAGAFRVPNWGIATSLVPPGLEDLPTPATPDWNDTPLAQRRAIAAEAVARWSSAANGAFPVLRIALPNGPGANLLFGAIRRDWRAIGVAVERVAPNAPAEIGLIDAVAPADIASWYLRGFTCDRSRACSEQADASLVAASKATTLEERTAQLADADARLAAITAFIPLAGPLRWSVVAPKLRGFQPNPRGVHPLNHLR